MFGAVKESALNVAHMAKGIYAEASMRLCTCARNWAGSRFSSCWEASLSLLSSTLKPLDGAMGLFAVACLGTPDWAAVRRSTDQRHACRTYDRVTDRLGHLMRAAIPHPQ